MASPRNTATLRLSIGGRSELARMHRPGRRGTVPLLLQKFPRRFCGFDDPLRVTTGAAVQVVVVRIGAERSLRRPTENSETCVNESLAIASGLGRSSRWRA